MKQFSNIITRTCLIHVFENIVNTKKCVFFLNSYLLFKFSVFFGIFYIFQKKKPKTKNVFPIFLVFRYSLINEA